ncbi:hypothetical protein HK105_207943 [Polyrhizophydium stewartii]|uniref:Uncharacterized protein n=1 Tax=Polyrhizophydium stewartii TaxID=2732419 RepID=A0ABR4MZ45_9FUNG
MLGVAVHEIASSAYFMLSARRDSWRAPIFRLCCVALVFVGVLTVLELSIIDWYISPYQQGDKFWHPKMVIAGFVCNTISMTLVPMQLVLFVVRLRVFHRGASPTFWGLSFVAFATFCFSVPANVVAIMTNLEARHAQVSNALFAASHGLEGVFSAVCSVLFLWSIAKGLGISRKDFIWEIVIKHEGVRFACIFVLNIIIAGFAIHAYAHSFNYVTYTAFYMPPLIYAIEIHTFLLTSYRATREMLDNNRADTSTLSGNMRRVGGGIAAIGTSGRAPAGAATVRITPAIKNDHERTRLDAELDEQRRSTVMLF